jgi:hypothetical protein
MTKIRKNRLGYWKLEIGICLRFGICNLGFKAYLEGWTLGEEIRDQKGGSLQ